MGFPVPVGRWLRGPLPAARRRARARHRARSSGDSSIRGALRRLAEAHRSGAAEHGDRLWLLVNLELWQRMFVDGEDAGDRDARSGGAMRMIWVKVGGLWPVNTGGRIRSFHMLRELSRRHQVTLLTTHAARRRSVGARGRRSRGARWSRCPWALAKRGSARFAAGTRRVVALAAAGRSVQGAGPGPAPRDRSAGSQAAASICRRRLPAGGAQRRRRRHACRPCSSPTTSST